MQHSTRRRTWTTQPSGISTTGIFSILILLFLFAGTLPAQTTVCGFDPVYDSLMTEYPQLEAIYRYNETMMQQMMEQDSMAVMYGETYTVPIVVHVIHLGETVGTGTNISDAQVISAIDDLNDRYALHTYCIL